MPSVTPRHPLSQPNPHSTDADGELPTLPRRPAPLPAGPAPDSGSLPSPLDAQHRALPATEPVIEPLPAAAPAVPAAHADAPDRAGVHPIPPTVTAHIPLSARTSRPHRNPRVLAALAYVLPLLPALVLLLRERRNRFVRVHAAQALVFYLLVGGWQLALFFAAVGTGDVFTDLHTDVVVGLAFVAVFVLMAVLSLLLWLRLLADAMGGQRTLFPVLSLWAERIERLTAYRSRVPSESAPAPENGPVP